MVSQNPNESQASQVTASKVIAADPVPPMDPTTPIETANQGSGPVNDPPASDTKPPTNNYDFDSYLA